MTSEVRAFLRGIRPSVLVGRRVNGFSELMRYPYRNRGDSYLFFRNEEALQKYEEKRRECPSWRERIELDGITLGYPPKAAKWFAETFVPPLTEEERLDEEKMAERRALVARLDRERVRMEYAGIGCVGSTKDLVENIHWFWDTYEEDEDVTIRMPLRIEAKPNRHGRLIRRPVSMVTFNVGYRDEDTLEKVAQILVNYHK